MRYAYAIGSLALLVLWWVLHLSLGDRVLRREMWIVSLWTLPLGLTEPVFVPAYWHPPSLLDLAARTGFDLESLVFSFSVGGIAAVVYEAVGRPGHEPVPARDRSSRRHRFHRLALAASPLAFAVLHAATPLNPIYCAVLALIAGAAAAAACRPDLAFSMLVGGFLFAVLYFAFFVSLVLAFPGWVEAAWSLEALSGVIMWGVPLEEIAFAFALGLLWSSLYEHVAWVRHARPGRP